MTHAFASPISDTPRDGYVATDRLRFHYLEWGVPGRPIIVLLHALTTSAHSWLRIAPALAEQFHVIALDQRNHGDSDHTDVLGTRETMADDLAAALDGLAINRVALVGHSMGGNAAMAFATRFPDRVWRLVIEDIGVDPPPAAAARFRSGRPPGPEVFADMDHLQRWLRNIRPYADDPWIRLQAECLRAPSPDDAVRIKYRFVPSGGRDVATEDLWPVLAGVTCPVLIIRGEDSQILDAAQTARMVATFPHAREALIPRAGHMTHEDNPEAVIAVLRDFFDITHHRTPRSAS